MAVKGPLALLRLKGPDPYDDLTPTFTKGYYEYTPPVEGTSGPNPEAWGIRVHDVHPDYHHGLRELFTSQSEIQVEAATKDGYLVVGTVVIAELSTEPGNNHLYLRGLGEPRVSHP